MVPGCLRVSTDHMSKTGRRYDGTSGQRDDGTKGRQDDGTKGRQDAGTRDDGTSKSMSIL